MLWQDSGKDHVQGEEFVQLGRQGICWRESLRVICSGCSEWWIVLDVWLEMEAILEVDLEFGE